MMEKVVQRSDPRELLSLVCGGGLLRYFFPRLVWYLFVSIHGHAMGGVLG
jgi:hypothetical protein